MRKKLLSSLSLSLALAGSMVVPTLAADDNDMFRSILNFPLKVAGSCVGTAVGIPEGMVKDGVKGAIKSTRWAAGKLGNEDGLCTQMLGAVVAGPFGLVGGSGYGVVDGGVHGVKVGYEKPFSKDAFTYKDE